MTRLASQILLVTSNKDLVNNCQHLLGDYANIEKMMRIINGTKKLLTPTELKLDLEN